MVGLLECWVRSKCDSLPSSVPLNELKAPFVEEKSVKCASRIKVTRERTGGLGQARRASRLVVCVLVCYSDSLAIMKKLL